MSSLRLTQKLSQRMVLTPQLRQRIEMLQMTTAELSDLIQQELVENPVLDEVSPDEEIQEISENILDQNTDGDDGNYENGADKELENLPVKDEIDNQGAENVAENIQDFEAENEDFAEEKSDAFEEMDYGREFQDYLDPGYKTQELEFKEDAPSFDQFLSRAPSLTDHLEWQLNLQQISDKLEEVAVCVIGNLNEDGRLIATDEEIAAMCECSFEQVERARQIVMRLDPVGCGARNVKECLFVQLEAHGSGESLAADLILNHLEDIQPHRLQHLSKDTGVSVQELNEEIKKIRCLDPYPGRAYSSDQPMYVSPEVYIEKLEDDYIVYFTDDGSPRLRISPSYHQLLDHEETSKETKDFIKGKVRSAVDLLRNIEHRRQTIYRVVECIVERQREFLDKGVEFIKPMMLKDVAEDIGMHLSTISRVVNRKYAHTPQGVIELRRFFSEGMLNEDGEEVSTRILKLRIKKMVEQENTQKPFTDEQIAKILTKEGVKLSRRTIAKYRDQMQIPGSRERKTVV
ncbi:MAG: RNA polymerase factor sigma-54 [Pyrinomonadaceae bacterium]